ncbi:hypothetical protein [Alienimonas chondri]|uniref:Uncharacterized protein n=1 Tax=Alienimonas chondri TaxID=2681879 RepID=A0ABX1VA37_9PLAN|nr:hypothetical protein [Alienimonas chondri]NNJ24914.1 hypothetical protein [Alienimonas chondri]
MSIIKTSAAAAMLAGCFAFGSTNTAEAGGFSLQIGRPAYGGSYYGSNFNRGYYGNSFNRGYYGSGFNRGYYSGGLNRGYYGGFGGTSVYHDTSHIDVINGRPVLHRSGHFDYYGPGHFGGHGGLGGHHDHH